MSENTAVVILAGGGGKRLGGVIKANLKIDGVTLFERVAENVGQMEGPHILSIGHMKKQRFMVPKKWIILNDMNNDSNIKGPLAGLAAGVDYIMRHAKNTDYLLTVAVDSPFFPDFFHSMALEAINNNKDAVVASFGGQIYPTNALWRLNSINNLPEELKGLAKYGIKGLLRKIRVKELAMDEYCKENPCQNLNNVTDIANINDRAKIMASQPQKKYDN
ncbi:MAG: NTP transferase domain-containing protein [Devosiaceae bacterium]|nr:NTP transferase domain-containing protein [Devosiaceae bacterium]